MSINMAFVVPILTFYAGLFVGIVVHFLLVDFRERDEQCHDSDVEV